MSDQPKILVTGSRHWTDEHTIRQVLRKEARQLAEQASLLGAPIVLIHGNARGADKMADRLGKDLGWEVRSYPADWRQYGPSAGPKRNDQMLDEQPHLVVAFHDDLRHSKGTLDCVSKAASRGIPVHLHGSENEL